MKNIAIMLLVIVTTGFSYAQTASDIGKIALSVVMPENIDGLDATQLSKLNTKITQIVTMSGLAASGYNHNFVIYPVFAIYDSSVVEGGLQSITVVTAELNLFIKQVNNNIIYSSMSKQLKGSGSNKQLAITNAISNVPVNSNEFKTFIATSKPKIIKYYEASCSDIITKAVSLSLMQDYKQALGLLLAVPEEVNCYNRILEISVEVFLDYQNKICDTQIQEAKTVLAANNYTGALQILSKIDPSTSCFAETQLLIKNAEAEIDTEEIKQWELQMSIYNDAISLERQRINAVKEIACEYYRSTPSIVQYNYIIR